MSKRSPGKAYPYVCRGGPLDGETIMLRNTSTAQVRIGRQRGTYVSIKHCPGEGSTVDWFAS